jgi:hypothetical protein
MTFAANGQTKPVIASARERVVLLACVGVALAFGAFAALGSAQWLAMTIVVILLFVAALTLPLSSVALVLAALLPFQIYFQIPGTSLTLRATELFVLAAALRVLVQRVARKDWARWQFWILPAALFLLVASVAALGAENRYLAFKGIQDWLVIFAAVFVFGEVASSRPIVVRLVLVLIAGGVEQAVLGLLEYASGVTSILDVLRMPVSTIFFQPNLLNERLADGSFNWIVFDRASPFGTFINGIDYAIFLATILGLALALLFAERVPLRFGLFFGSVLLMGAALLLTFKGSGLIALVGAAVTVVLFSLHRLSPRMFAIGLIGLGSAILLALPFTDLIVQRALFLVQREQGGTGTAGRLEIWASLMQVFAQRPVFGYGLNQAAVLTEATPTLNRGAFGFNYPSAESAYVAALVDTGMAGFAALMALFTATLARAARRADSDALYVGILAAMVALLVGNLTVAGFTTDQNGMLLGMLIGMVFGKCKPQ